LTIGEIRKKSAVLGELESKGAIKIAGSMYNLETATVNFFAWSGNKAIRAGFSCEKPDFGSQREVAETSLA
jgi:hypothetical protein